MCAPVLPCGSSGGSSYMMARASAIATARRRQELAPGLILRSPLQQVRPCYQLDWTGSFESELRCLGGQVESYVYICVVDGGPIHGTACSQ